MRIPPDQILALPLSDVAALPIDVLFQLKNDAADLLSAAKAIVEQIDRALELKYAFEAQGQRLAAGKDNGIVHFTDLHLLD